MKTQIDEDQIVAALLIKAETQGYVIVDDILELLPDLEDSSDLLDRVISLLTDTGVQVQDLSADDEDDGDHYKPASSYKPAAYDPSLDDGFGKSSRRYKF